MGLLEKSMGSRMESKGTSSSFLRGLLHLAESQGDEVLIDVNFDIPRRVYDMMIESGCYSPQPRSEGDRRNGDRRKANRRG